MARTTQLVIYEKPTGKKDGSKVLTTLIWPTGFSILPDNSIINENDYILMKYFHGFLQGEREGCATIMKRKGR